MLRKAVRSMKLLEDIYFGNLAPNEIEIEKGSEMDIQLKKIIKCEEELTSQLYKEQRALFEKLRFEQSKMNSLTMNSLTECKSFQNGVTFGVKLMTEVFADKDRVEE